MIDTTQIFDNSYEQRDGIWLSWPEDMTELARDEAEYHDHFEEDARQVHQLERWRNWYYHNRIWQVLRQLRNGGLLLEIGTGSGFDAEQLRDQYQLVLSDISPQSLARTRRRILDDHIVYVAADGSRLPFRDAVFDGVFMVATLHHFVAPEQVINDSWRVLKPGGIIVIGIEPNAAYFRWVKICRRLLCAVARMYHDDGSHADAEMSGFSAEGLQGLFLSEKWESVQLEPVWFLAGWLHYSLELIFRAGRLRRRVVLPVWLEQCIVSLDEFLFTIPGVRHIGWHWTIAAQKKR